MIKRCNECRNGVKECGSVVCTEPRVAARNIRYLTGAETGALAFYERIRWSPFAPCGRAGKLWEPREG